MAWANEGRQGLALGGDEVLLEGDTLVAVKDRFSCPDEPVAVAHGSGHMRNLVAAGFPLPHGTTKTPEGFQEEGLDVVGLEAPRLGSLHVLPDPAQPLGVDDLLRQGSLLDRIPKARGVQSLVDGLGVSSPHLRPFSVSDGLDEEVSKGSSLELQLAEDVEDLASQGLARIL